MKCFGVSHLIDRNPIFNCSTCCFFKVQTKISIVNFIDFFCTSSFPHKTKFLILDEINGAELQVNGNSGGDSQSSSSNQKYSQILGDHHTNYTTQLSNKSTSSSSSQPHPNNFRARSFNNNKEKYYNQRSALRGASGGLKNGWRGNNGSSTNYRANAYSLKDNKKVDENVKSGANNAGVDNGKEAIKFIEV